MRASPHRQGAMDPFPPEGSGSIAAHVIPEARSEAQNMQRARDGTSSGQTGDPAMGGRPRLTLADFETAGAKINLKWLGTELPGARAKTLWECLTCGKTCSIKYTHVNDGHGCRKCRDAKRKKPDDYRELGVKTGFEWLGPEVMTTSQETSWRCPICGKPFPASYSHIRQGLGHKRCTRNQLTPSRLRAAAKAKDFIWLGTEPGKRKTLERWKCRKCGRPFRASYDAVVRKRRCAYCPKPAERLRTPPAKYKALAEGTGLIWLR